MEYIIKPFYGVNEITFGMTQLEVESKIGKAEKEKHALLNNIIEVRDNVSFIYIDRKLMDIKFDKNFQYENHKIILNDQLLFNNENTVNELIKNSDTLPSDIIKNCIVFYGIGLCFIGFKDMKIQTDKELRIFSKERIRFYKIFLNA